MKKDKKKEENKQLNFQQQIPTGQPGMMPQAYMMPMQPYPMPMQQMYYMPQSYMMPMQPQMPTGQPGMMPQANYGYNYQNVGYNVSNNLNSINQSQWRQI